MVNIGSVIENRRSWPEMSKRKKKKLGKCVSSSKLIGDTCLSSDSFLQWWQDRKGKGKSAEVDLEWWLCQTYEAKEVESDVERGFQCIIMCWPHMWMWGQKEVDKPGESRVQGTGVSLWEVRKLMGPELGLSIRHWRQHERKGIDFKIRQTGIWIAAPVRIFTWL